MPFSRAVFKLGGKLMRMYWSGDGKRAMCAAVDYMSVVMKVQDGNKTATDRLQQVLGRHISSDKLKMLLYEIGDSQADRVHNLVFADKLEELNQFIPWHVTGMSARELTAWLKCLNQELTAYKNGDTSMIEDIGIDTAWHKNTFYTTPQPLVLASYAGAIGGGNPPSVSPAPKPALGASPSAISTKETEVRRGARDRGPPKKYDESNYTEEEFNETIDSPKAAKDLIVTKVPAEAPAVARSFPELDRFLYGPVKKNTTGISETDEDLAWTLCDMQQQSCSKDKPAATSSKQPSASSNQPAAASNQPVDKTSRITSAHVSGLLALNPGSAAMESPAPSASGAPPVAINAAPAEAAAAAVSGLHGLYKIRAHMKAPAEPVPSAVATSSDTQAPSNQGNKVASDDAVMNDTQSESAPGETVMPEVGGATQIEEISTKGVMFNLLQEV
jgi:hypothetical protein